jgi:hypothetical protein
MRFLFDKFVDFFAKKKLDEALARDIAVIAQKIKANVHWLNKSKLTVANWIRENSPNSNTT